MDAYSQFATRDEFWRLQEDLKDIYAAQAQQAERISRLEKRREEDSRMKNLWGPQSPFPTGVASTPQTDFNPAAEAFKNFESESQSGMISSLHLDHEDDRRRGASRANSVRFDESALNHYGASSRQSMEMLPVRTGSGMGMSERSYSHRSDGRASTSGLSMRANSFGLESSRLLGSSSDSPRTAPHPAPGFLFLGPVPSIIRCWLSEDFSTNSVLYAAVCTGSYASCISRAVVQQLGLEENIQDDAGVPKIKLSLFLTEATIQHSSSSRSSSPLPQVPAISARFIIFEASENDPSIQVFLGSDVLRSHNADILFSEDRLLIFDEERNRLAVPLVRPESEATYRSLWAGSQSQTSIPAGHESEKTPSRAAANGQYPIGSLQSPPKFDLQDSMTGSSAPTSPAVLPSADPMRQAETSKNNSEAAQVMGDRSKAEESQGSGSEKSYSAPKAQTPSGVWGNSWRAGPVPGQTSDAAKSTASGYSRAASGRSMKVLRPSTGKTMANATRAFSAAGAGFGSGNDPKPVEQSRRSSQTSLTDTKAASSTKSTTDAAAAAGPVPTKANPIGQASAFGWLNSASTTNSRTKASD